MGVVGVVLVAVVGVMVVARWAADPVGFVRQGGCTCVRVGVAAGVGGCVMLHQTVEAA